MTRDDRLRIAVFIDFDNIEIGVKNTLSASFDAGLVLEALRERGDVVSKTAYSDWQRAGNSYSRMLTQHAIKMVQRNLTPGGDKNGADINLALDALEMAFTHPHINAFVIVGGDSDFISLVEKLKQYDKKVFVVGGRQFTSIIMQRNCHEFIAYEHLVASAPAAVAAEGRRQSGRPQVRVERAPIEQVVPLVSRALQVLSEREVAPQMGLLKTTLLQLDSTFSERDYGAGSFRDFVQKLEKIGVVTLQQGKGGLLVGPGEGKPVSAETVPDDGEPSVTAVAGTGTEGEVTAAAAAPLNGGFTNGSAGVSSAAPGALGSNADGVAEFARLLGTGQVRRWPMYLRNVKQFLRQVSPDFDERAYGFASLVDLLRAAGREGLVRVDRDRQGVIRVFQGSSAPVASIGMPASAAPQLGNGLDNGNEAIDVVIGEVVPTSDATPGVTGDDEDEFNRAVPMAASAASPAVAAPEFDEDPDDSIGNRLAPGEVREELIPRGGAKKPPSSRRPATAPPRRRAATVPTHHASGHGATKRAPRARKTRRSRP